MPNNLMNSRQYVFKVYEMIKSSFFSLDTLLAIITFPLVIHWLDLLDTG